MSSEKVPANPIPERSYERFKYRLEEKSKVYSERNIMLFLLGVATGYRTQDLVELTIGEIKEALENEKFVIQEKKQYKTWLKSIKTNPSKKPPKKREAAIKPNLRKLLKQYIKNKNMSEYAFSSNKGDRFIEAKSFSRILSDVGADLGLKHISGHSMRKTYAHRLWEVKKDLEYVRLALGHKNIETTKVYLGLEDEVKEDAAEITDERL